jgi:hypothetical protein
VLVSNDDSDDIRNMYSSVKRLQFAHASCLSAKSIGRRQIRETVHVLHPKGEPMGLILRKEEGRRGE